MITCVVTGCPSIQNPTDSNPITFFPFPEDDLRKNQWLRNCDLVPNVKEPLHICEHHFEKVHFTPDRDLKPSAVPTLFDRTEESSKEKAEDISQTPSKQKKLDEHSHALVTPPQSPSMQDNTGDSFSGNKGDMSMDHIIAINGSAISTSITHENSQMGLKTYRLIIQIDKIRSKPGPKSKKISSLISFNNDTKNVKTSESGIGKKLRPLRIRKPCAKGNCKLKKCVYKSRLAFQCELCDKYYLAKKEETKSYSCTKCSKTFANPQLLYTHIRKHFMCDICLTECSSQMAFDKHIRLHVSTDPLYPYKCHQCLKIFDVKDGVKQHCLLEHPKISLQNTVLQVSPSSITTIVPQQNDYLCMNCNISFTSDQAYRNHMSSSHGKKESFTCNISSEANNIIPVPNPLTGSQIGILQAVKFSCRVCFKEFDNVGEVDLHTRTHLEDIGRSDKCE